jgi:hypothetical protein
VEVVITGSADDAARTVADVVIDALADRDAPVIGLATGSSPLGAYRLLIDACGDEVAAGAWSGPPLAQAWSATRGAGTSQEIGAVFLREVIDLVRRTTGRRVGVWQEGAESGALRPDDGYVVGWRSSEASRRLAALGYDVVSAPAEAYYLDMAASSDWYEPGTSWAGHTSVADIAAFDPTAGWSAAERARLLGSRRACGPSTSPTARRWSGCCSRASLPSPRQPGRGRRRADALPTIAAMKVRRVVTGHDDKGKAVVASDSEVDGFRPALLPGSEFHFLWGGDEAPRFPDDGSMKPYAAYFPPVGGFRFGFFTVPPSDGGEVAGAPDDLEGAMAEFEANMPGLPGYMEPDAPGMHTTDTIDFEVVLDGEVWLELDDGVEVHLEPGDTVVQNGTRHAWRNHGNAPCRLAVFLIGAHHDEVTRPA